MRMYEGERQLFGELPSIANTTESTQLHKMRKHRLRSLLWQEAKTKARFTAFARTEHLTPTDARVRRDEKPGSARSSAGRQVLQRDEGNDWRLPAVLF
jgi:hypothetical protein